MALVQMMMLMRRSRARLLLGGETRRSRRTSRSILPRAHTSVDRKNSLTKTLTSHGRSKRPTSPHTHFSFICFVFFAGAGAARFGVGVADAFDAPPPPPSLWAAYASAIFAMFAFEATSCATIGLG